MGIDQLIWDEQISADEETTAVGEISDKVNGNDAETPTRTKRGATKAVSQRNSAVLTDTVDSRVEADSTLHTTAPASPEELEPPAATGSLNGDREEARDTLNGESKEGCDTVKVEIIEPPAMETSPAPKRTVLPVSPSNAKQVGTVYLYNMCLCRVVSVRY